MTAVLVEMLGVGGFNMDGSAELTVVNMDIDIQKSDVTLVISRETVASQFQNPTYVRPLYEKISNRY